MRDADVFTYLPDRRLAFVPIGGAGQETIAVSIGRDGRLRDLRGGLGAASDRRVTLTPADGQVRPPRRAGLRAPVGRPGG